MTKSNKPSAEFKFIDLPRTKLHYLKSGIGPPLIIVPALASKLEQWLPLTQFMGQKFTTYFFELPGHGESTPYPEPFQTHFVPATVEAMIDKLGIDRFTLMGFSFGGLLSLRTLEHLLPRIDRVVLLAPAVSKRALLLSRKKKFIFKSALRLLKNNAIRNYVIDSLNSETKYPKFITTISKFVNIDENIFLQKTHLDFPKSTLEVLSEELYEISHIDYDYKEKPFNIPCFYGMSLYDDVLDFETTTEIVKGLFSNIQIEEFTMPYHQSPIPYTYNDFNEKFGSFLNNITNIYNKE